ncbi:MAG: DNA-deoxyinosine glycosylase [Clostridiales bacterium]|nr:DNA-deoxyinosine glycosylase [Clostridiales bacterium]
MREFHTIPPLYNENSKILILGSFPSVKSRETEFFYGHPQNRFWKVMAALFREKIPESTEEKKSLLLSHGVALWDAVYSCDIVGSSDSSIKNVIPNDILFILSKTSVSKIFLNGKTAEKYYKKYIEKDVDIKAVCLPSTSPANASVSLDELIKKWSVIIN